MIRSGAGHMLVPFPGVWETEMILLQRSVIFGLSITPILAWFLMVSARARRSPALIACGLLLGAMMIERIVLGSTFLLN